MRTQRFVERCQIVAVFACADRLVLAGDEDDVAHAVLGQFEAGAAFLPAEHQRDTLHLGKLGHDVGAVGALRQIGGGKGTQCAMMHDIGIGDR